MNEKKDDRRIFSAEAILEGISPLKDGGMSVRFHTNEIPKDKQVILLSFYQKFGHVLFAEDVIKEDMIPEQNTDIEGRKIKTPSQRVRAILYLLWKESDQSLTQDQYYEQQMEKIITVLKGKLPE